MRHQLGHLEVIALQDASGVFFDPAEAAFPGAREADFDAARELDPDAFGDEGSWRLTFRCFAIREPDDRVTLVDAGIGAADAPAASWAPVPGALPSELSAAGIEPGQVRTVVLTHLHSDHCGWAGLFPNARYLVQRAELDWLPAESPVGRQIVKPLRDNGLLHAIDGDCGLGEGLRVVHTPGHTPGHQSVIAEHGGKQVVLTGDVILHALHLVRPEIGYAHDEDQDRARETRVGLVAGAREAGALLATPHLNIPFLPA